MVEAQWAARERHLERFRTEQPPYLNPADTSYGEQVLEPALRRR